MKTEKEDVNGRSEAEKAYHQAIEAVKKAKKSNQESYRNAQLDVGLTSDFSKHLDALAAEDNSYVTTWHERARTKKYGQRI